MQSLEIIEVPFGDGIAELTVKRRPRHEGDVYSITFNNVSRVYIGDYNNDHADRICHDLEAVNKFRQLMANESMAKSIFNVKE